MTKGTARGGVIACCAGVMVTLGCSSVLDKVIDGTVSGIGNAARDHAEKKSYEAARPEESGSSGSGGSAAGSAQWHNIMIMQAQMAFSYAFAANGFWLGQSPYEQGQWTRFELKQEEDDQKVEFEKAFLTTDDKGNQWWRVSWKTGDQSFVYEGLIDPESGSVKRLRAKDTDGTVGEIPVTEQTRTIYSEPQKLTEESIEGATIGTEQLQTPAGTFTSEHVQYMAMGMGGNMEWWLTPDVPGGVAKYLINDDREKRVWTCTVTALGDDAETVLDSY